MDFLTSMSFIFLLVISAVTGFSSGPPSTACDFMAPNHNGIPAQSAASSPYSILTNQNTYAPGDTISVTITGATFRGFFLQARAASNDQHVGSFSPIANTKALTCNGNTAVSHSTPLLTNSITLDWTAPNLDEDIQIFATVVQAYNVFWVKIPGPVLSRTPSCDIPGHQFTLAELSVESYAVSWKAPANGKIEFTVSGAVGTDSSNKYVAIGFSNDNLMGSDSVVDCIEKGVNGVVSVQASYNGGKFNSVNSAGNAGLQLISGSRTNGILKCVFQRDISRAGDNEFFDLSAGTYRLFVASGNVSAGDIKMLHSLQATHRPVLSTEKIDFLTPGTYQTLQ